MPSHALRGYPHVKCTCWRWSGHWQTLHLVSMEGWVGGGECGA